MQQPTGITGDGLSIYIYGYEVDSVLNTNSILIRLDFNLDTAWTSILDKGRFETARSGIINNIGGITLTASATSAGNSNGNILLYKYDSTGSILFVETIAGFGNEPFSSSLIETQDNGFFIVSTTYNNLNHSSACAFKTDSLGEILTSIVLTANPTLAIYPNPSNGIFYFDNNPTILKLELFDLQEKLNQFSEYQIDLTEYENGIYIYKAYINHDEVIFEN
ncbi:MAG: T9SS type A sorting domain-containing protein [Bacteroidetes bacterium]|nr:T9SS type A sorting domain-containing protein [Bacteroidota bacterium]